MKRMKNIMAAALMAVLFAGCEEKEMPVPDRFTDEVRRATTPVKDQGRSSLCWAYAMLATIETEHIMRGDSVNLSTAYVARSFIKEQVDRMLTSV